MNKEIKIKAGRAENGMTLQQFLAGRLNISRHAAKDLIDQRRVFVNGRRIWMARHCLKTGDMVNGPAYLARAVATYDKLATSPADGQPAILTVGPAALGKHPAISRSLILYEDNDYLIAGKPAGILSNGPKSLEEQLAARLGLSALMAGHRLDKDTSGCLLFAKHQKARERIISLFAQNKITKKYEAIIRGRLPKETLTITRPIDGQKAVTHIRLLAATPAASPAGSGASHVSILIETGRTHQIRKHLAAIGHPVLGDQHYGVGRAVPQGERLIERQMLHAAEIKFIQPLTGKPVHCHAPLPADMKDCLRQYHLK